MLGEALQQKNQSFLNNQCTLDDFYKAIKNMNAAIIKEKLSNYTAEIDLLDSLTPVEKRTTLGVSSTAPPKPKIAEENVKYENPFKAKLKLCMKKDKSASILGI